MQYALYRSLRQRKYFNTLEGLSNFLSSMPAEVLQLVYSMKITEDTEQVKYEE